MNKPLFIGIDPGTPLAMALVCDRGWIGHASETTVADHIGGGKGWQNSPVKIAAIMGAWKKFGEMHGYDTHVCIEHVSARMGEGITSATKFVGSMHLCEGIAAALDIPVRKVTPSVWKRHLGLNSDKEKSLKTARGLYNERAWRLKRKADHNYAEAALLATYGLQTL